MPYTVENPPEQIKKLPHHAIEIWVSAYNSAFKQYDGDEAKSAGTAWAAVKTQYEQNPEGEWIRKAKEESMINLGDLDTVQKTYAMHNRLHAEYLDARHTNRKKLQIQEDHEAVVKHILDLRGRHIAKGDALDDTLPSELKNNTKLRYVCDGFVCSDAEPSTSEIQILRTGTFHHPQYGKFTITDETIEAMVNNFGKVKPKSPTELVVDYEHLSAGEVDKPEQGVAAGWIKNLTKNDGKLFATVEWTEEASEAIKEKKFKFISPEFDLNYTDKETGKKIGPTLISSALTNRPFLEGMEPVVLSESLGAMIFSEEIQMTAKINDELIGTGEDPEICLAEWDTKYINDLPDSSFAYIRSGGEKEDGKTVPRALRYLPYKNAAGEVDMPHLRNALARLPQTKLRPDEKNKARKVLVAAARKAGVGEYSELPNITEEQWKEGTKLDEKTIREILELSEDADVKEAIQNIKAKCTEQAIQLTELQKRVDEAEKKLKDTEVEAAVDEALKAGKITPKMKEWAAATILKDPEGFKNFVEITEKVGPDLTIKGKEGGEGEGDSVQLSETEKKIAKKLGVSEELLIETKKAEKEGK